MPLPRRGAGGPQKPACPTHTSDMAYDPDRMVWACTEPSCKMIALPKEDVDAGKGKPRIGEGILELVKQSSAKGKRDRYLLRAPDNNVLIDLTGYLTSVSVEHGGRTSSGAYYEVTLRINNMTEIRET